jgi:DNA-binding GntR family transcriptional regulator
METGRGKMQNLNNSETTVLGIQGRKSLGRKAISLADLVTRQIRESIITGEFAPGQRLKEDELCRMFDISRPPIREAFKTLQANGILDHKPRRGVFVTQFTDQDIVEVYTINAMLYDKTTDIALDLITDRDIAELKGYLEKMIRAVEADPYNVREYQLAHGEFHQFIMEISGYRRIKELDRQLRDLVFIFSYKSLKEKSHLKKSLRYHCEIFKAIQERDKEKALLLTREHVFSAITFLQGRFPARKVQGNSENAAVG